MAGSLVSGDEISPPEPLSPTVNREYRIVVLGKRRAGKTHFINKLFDVKEETIYSPSPAQNTSYSRRVRKYGVCISIFDSSVDANAARSLKKLASDTNSKADLVILCITIGPASKFNNEHNQNLIKRLQEAFGCGIWKRCINVFTFGNFARQTCNSIDEYVTYIREYSNLFQEELQRNQTKDIKVKTIFDYSSDMVKIEDNTIISIPAGKEPTDDVLPGVNGNWIDAIDTMIVQKFNLEGTPDLLKYRGPFSGLLEFMRGPTVKKETLRPTTDQPTREEVEKLQRRAESAERRLQEHELEVQERERRLSTEVQERERRLSTEAAEFKKRAIEAEKKTATAERVCQTYKEGNELLEKRVKECEHQLQQMERECQWAIRREEVQLTGPELGRGGWATVSVAIFRGVRVAAKCIHHTIISPYNKRLFKREMNMAARLRHPNLAQFIGANTEGEMMILTELMPTSLRRELEKNCITKDHVSPISLDVARALNYLHLMQPGPIIHRDISSANVLLQPLPGDCWRAKVTDYGSVNLQRRLQTEGPGNPTYAAPEANIPSQQSSKMDIFSFGVLLIEMLTGELPPPNERYRLMGYITNPQLLDLIRRCLRDQKDRPNASDIISELDK